MSGSDELPPLQFHLWDKEGCQVRTKDFKETALKLDSPIVAAQYSRTGKYFAVSDNSVVKVYNTETHEVLTTINHPQVVFLSFSPLGTYVVTWERYTSAKEKDGGNTIVWRVSDGKEVFRCVMKNYVKEEGPVTTWSDDEQCCCRVYNGKIEIYGPDISQGVKFSLMPGSLGFAALAPGPAPYKLAVYLKEKKGAPAAVSIYQLPNVDEPVARKSFFKADTVKLRWSPSGRALNIIAQTDVDTTGKSYYGETHLFYMQSDGKKVENVQLMKEGPIHDMQWSPDGRDFMVISGFMPAKAVLYDSQCRPAYDFGSAPRNTIKWNPFGRFVLLGGFGNLAGDMEFWDKNKLKKIGTTRAECAVTCEWAPDGRHVMTATLSPRLRVDNGVKVWRYDGSLVYNEAFGELYQVAWKPTEKNAYPDRPASPSRKPSAEGETAPAPAPAKPTAWVPPHLRGKTQQRQTASLAQRAADTDNIEKPQKVLHKPATSSLPPGMYEEEVSKNSLKNKKKREKKKEKEAEEQLKAELSRPKSAPADAAGSGEGERRKSLETPEECAKRLKNLNKKLRQIDDIKAKKAEGKELDPMQIEKLSNESALRKEIAEVQGLLDKLELQ